MKINLNNIPYKHPIIIIYGMQSVKVYTLFYIEKKLWKNLLKGSR